MLKEVKPTIPGPVRVYYDTEWVEYRVVVKSKPEATYYTDDKSDAIGTAQCMRDTLMERGS